ncbi:hypothetical protein Barb4_05014 [Bacteroidales bacterium Barb4]|nr:hypothetical protein Barb4_05014 [Bacteroidales bacterium Barb4]
MTAEGKDGLIFNFWEAFFNEENIEGQSRIVRGFNINSDAHGLRAAFASGGIVKLEPIQTETNDIEYKDGAGRTFYIQKAEVQTPAASDISDFALREKCVGFASKISSSLSASDNDRIKFIDKIFNYIKSGKIEE